MRLFVFFVLSIASLAASAQTFDFACSTYSSRLKRDISGRLTIYDSRHINWVQRDYELDHDEVYSRNNTSSEEVAFRLYTHNEPTSWLVLPSRTLFKGLSSQLVMTYAPGGETSIIEASTVYLMKRLCLCRNQANLFFKNGSLERVMARELLSCHPSFCSIKDLYFQNQSPSK